jgi:hypothetical protein
MASGSRFFINSVKVLYDKNVRPSKREALLSYFSRKLTYIFAFSQDLSADLKSLNVNSSDKFIIRTFWAFDAKKHPIVKHRAVLPDPVSNYIMCLPLRLLDVQKLKHMIWRGRGFSIPTAAK